MRRRASSERFQQMLLATVPALVAGCVPFVADQQSASLMQSGKWEVTPSFSYVSFSQDGESEHVQSQYGARAGFGASDKVELRGTFERIKIDSDIGEDAASFNLFGVGAKFALIPDRLAFYLPVGFVTGEGLQTSDTWTAVPTMLATWRANNSFELTPAIKAIYPFAAEDPEVFVGVHLGAGISNDLAKWALRPEIGIVKNPGEEGTTWGWALGFSIRP